jgi:hypothetical protein
MNECCDSWRFRIGNEVHPIYQRSQRRLTRFLSHKYSQGNKEERSGVADYPKGCICIGVTIEAHIMCRIDGQAKHQIGRGVRYVRSVCGSALRIGR